MEELRAEIESLRDRIAALEGRSTVTAPFQVVDSSRRVLLTVDVDETGVHLILSNRAGERRVVLWEDTDGGACQIFSSKRPDGAVAGLYADADGGVLVLADHAGETIASLPKRGLAALLPHLLGG